MNQPIPKTFSLESERLLFRIPSKEDIPYVFEAFHSDGFLDGMTFDAPETEKDLAEAINAAHDNWTKGVAYSFSLYSKQSSKFVGRTGIRRAEVDDAWLIYYYIHPEYQRQGYATEAAKKMIEFGFSQLNAQLIEAYHAEFNKASQRTLEKIGMEFIERIPQSFQKNGKWIADNHFGLIKEKWVAQVALNQSLPVDANSCC